MNSQFTSREEIERIFGRVAVELRVDDSVDANDEDDIMTDIINEASQYVWQYLWTNYEEANLVNNVWVRTRATYVACHFLSTRRGNPGQFIDRFELYKEELQLVFARSLMVPEAPVIANDAPTMSNFIIDNRGIGPVQRVSAPESVGTYPGQRTNISNPYPENI